VVEYRSQRGHAADDTKRVDLREAIWQEGPTAFAFLVDEAGFLGPERTDTGLAYHRPGLHVRVDLILHHRESEVVTRLSSPNEAGGDLQASLGCLYVACGLGRLQAVPETAHSRHTMSKRIGQHAAALRGVLPYLDGAAGRELLRRCHRRLLPQG